MYSSSPLQYLNDISAWVSGVQDLEQLPGLIVFYTDLTVDDLGVFYNTSLTDKGWQLRTMSQSEKNGELIVGYDSVALGVDIIISPFDDGISKVELYFNDR